mmetsp:Transcript_107464/g.302403  ORF Transcript_107464/g.302403 Transcript_107464/m.302403 type:complete len:254 (-) Transcript_107464:19-780(-)
MAAHGRNFDDGTAEACALRGVGTILVDEVNHGLDVAEVRGLVEHGVLSDLGSDVHEAPAHVAVQGGVDVLPGSVLRQVDDLVRRLDEVGRQGRRRHAANGRLRPGRLWLLLRREVHASTRRAARHARFDEFGDLRVLAFHCHFLDGPAGFRQLRWVCAVLVDEGEDGRSAAKESGLVENAVLPDRRAGIHEVPTRVEGLVQGLPTALLCQIDQLVRSRHVFRAHLHGGAAGALSLGAREPNADPLELLGSGNV